MLPKLSNELTDKKIKLTCRTRGGAVRDHIGALRRDERVRVSVTLPRTVGAAGIVIRISPDGAEGYTDLPFEYVGDRHDFTDDIYELSLSPDDFMDAGVDHGLFYYEFLLLRGLDTLFLSTQNNVDITFGRESGMRFRMLVYGNEYKTPEWLGGGVMYHVFVDRFCRGSEYCEPPRGGSIDEDWQNGIPQYAEYPGGKVANNVFFGGNLYGVIEKLPYLASLGVSVVYLSPIFSAASNHKYDTADYLSVAAEFGGERALRLLLDSAHAAGIRVILDGVFNHTGDDSVYFDKYHRYGGGAWDDPESPYRAWYHFKENAADGELTYAAWWGISILPKLDLTCPECRDFFIGEGGVCERYIKLGCDGWRLDVADELPDDFLCGLRERVKGASHDAAIIGEVWENAADKISYGQRRDYFGGRQLDSVMNYPLRSALLGYAETADAEFLADELRDIYSSYPRPAADVLMNIIGTHDTERVLTLLGAPQRISELDGEGNAARAAFKLTAEERAEAIKKLKLISVIQYTVYGFPCVYYGDEVGMEGAGDPFCRRPMVWDERASEELCSHYRRLGSIRQNTVFDRGEFAVLRAEGGYIEFLREKQTEDGTVRVRVAANLGETAAVMHARGEYHDLYADERGRGDISLQRYAFAVIDESKKRRKKIRKDTREVMA